MLPPGFHKFSAAAENLTLLADAGDFFALIGGANPYLLLELNIWQRGTTTLTMDSILLHRGTAGAGGGALTEYELTPSGAVATTAAVSLPTTDVSTDTWQYRRGFNLLQEQVNLMIPELWVPAAANVDFGLTRATTTAHTGVGVQAIWAEFTGD